MPKDETNQVERKTALKSLREAAELTQSQVAYWLNKDVSTIRRWESGNEPALTHQEWLKLCELFKINFYDLPKFLSAYTDNPSEHPQVTE
ncbi:helix-turn-helix transcriptional regulator [Calothrix sp. CCY 0018]|uniref:helix-turn-helix transcriptional regulator n=1 Tax=Calothrix sp. CCY 0018 TaxID=3103864 RepID=UPI0039C60010